MLRASVTHEGASVRAVLPRPSNMHAHFRWDGMIEAVAPENMRHFKHVLAMPNNGPGEGGIIRTVEDATRVYHRIMDARAKHRLYTCDGPVMTLYLTKEVTPRVVEQVARSHIVRAVKSYPAHGGTTNSGHGVPFDECEETIRAMEETGVPLLVHAEDVVDLAGRPLHHSLREQHCIEHRLRRFRDKHPRLRLCVEHVSSKQAVQFVLDDASNRTVCTITPQHLLFTARDFERVSWANHLRCMPYVKTEEDRVMLEYLAFNGGKRCIAGDDTAPHPSVKKRVAFEEAACGCWTPHSIALYALLWHKTIGLDDPSFVRFLCHNGPDWWGLSRPAADDVVTIATEETKDIPEPTELPALADVIIPLGWSEDDDRLRVGLAAV